MHYSSNQPIRHKKVDGAGFALLAIALVAGTFAGYTVLKPNTHKDAKITTTRQATAKAVEPKAVSSRFMVVGDVFWGRLVPEESRGE